MSPSQQDLPHVGNDAEPASPVLDYGRSMLYGMQTGAQWGHCYENIYPVFFAFPAVFYPHGHFIEGWIVFEDQRNIILMEHGWLVSGEFIIDPTIVLGTNPTQTIRYYPGVTRSWEELDALENEMFPHVRFSDYGEDGMGHPGYKAAYDAALEKAQAIRAVSGKELIAVRASDIAEQQWAGLPTLEQDAGMLVIRLNESGTSETHWYKHEEKRES